MNKQMLMKVLLILFPVLSVGLATTVDSVTVFDTVAGTTEYYSYFDMVPVANLQLLLPMAAYLSLLSGILAGIYLGKKKAGCLKAAGYVAFAAAVVACIPVIIRGETMVIPNVGLPVFMIGEYLVSYFIGKQPQQTAENKKAPRLQKH